MNIICLIGIHQYLYLYLYLYLIHKYINYIVLIIYINGVIYHSCIQTKYGIYLRFYDITSNIIIMIYINYTLWQYYAFLITLFSTSVFFINNYKYEPSSYKNQTIHILGVQLPLAIGIYSFFSF
jgi:hypothetical protein